MCFCINAERLLEKYQTIWTKNEDLNWMLYFLTMLDTQNLK